MQARRTIHIATLALWGLLLAGTAAGEQISMTASGANPDAGGWIALDASGELTVNAYRLEPDTEYAVRVGGAERARFTTDYKGARRVFLSASELGGASAGSLVAVVRSGSRILSATLAEDPPSSGGSTSTGGGGSTVPGDQVSMVTLDGSGAGGWIQVQGDDLVVNVWGLPGSTDMTVRLDGSRIARFTTDSRGNRRVFVPLADLAGSPAGGAVSVVGPAGAALAADVPEGSSGGSGGSTPPPSDPPPPPPPPPTNVSEQAAIYAPLEPVNPSSGAGGWLRFDLDGQGAELTVNAYGLDADATYNLRVNGVKRGAFDTDYKGRRRAFYDVLSGDGANPRLPVDPRGMLVEVARGSRTALAAVLAGPLEPAGTVQDETEVLERVGAAHGTAQARYVVEDGGSRSFEVALGGVSSGNYAVRVGGSRVGTLRAPQGTGSIRFESDGSPNPLSFDPRGRPLELVGPDGSVAFSGDVRAAIPGAGGGGSGDAMPVEFTVRLPEFADNPAVALRLWRRPQGGAAWESAATVFLWPTEPGSGTVSYSFVDPVTGGVDTGDVTEVPARWGSNGALTLTIDYVRRGAEALFKVSALNAIGESPRSQNAVLR